MATASIYRPSLESLIQDKIPFTALPNSLIHHGELGLKPRDASVLNYLLSKPAQWNICPAAIAHALYISVSTVKRALSFLVKLGFAGYQRFADGHTKWFVKLPDEKPQYQKPHRAKPERVNESVLIKNDKLESNKETTNDVVVSLPDYVNGTPTVKKEFGSLDVSLQAAVLKTLAAAMLCAGKVKNPTAYLLGLVRNAAKGSFSTSKQQKTIIVSDISKPNKKLIAVNLRNELAAIKQLYDLVPNDLLLSQIQAVELKIQQVKND